MKKENTMYYDENGQDAGAQLTAVSYDRTQRAMVLDGRATLGGKPVTAEISGIATGKGEDGTVNMWLSSFQFVGRDGALNKIPGLNAVASLSPRQGAIDTARVIASYVNSAGTPYKATTSGNRAKATISINLACKKTSPRSTEKN